ncbi:MAG: hypothetical protein IK130_11040 [Oscillospiraceae bacterium]|nr:hypothetical protein [Oscillospiraceae bacterium]
MNTALADFRSKPLMRWLLQPRRIPLLYAVTIISGIFYHYAPSWTPVIIVTSVLLIGGLYMLFDYVKKHNFIGGIIFCVVGLLFLLTARWFWQAGYDTAILGPSDYNYQISFFVWFLTPQSVLQTDYAGYTIALYLLFTFFISFITYYFTLVRYRVLMSFMTMIFPFAIYAKENETMPIVSIILLFMCYFAVMVYCRQAHGEDSVVVQIYEPNAESTLAMPPKKSAFAGQKPEILDRRFVRSCGIFITAATIAVLIVPKPEVNADRALLDRMLDFSKFSDYLMNAISGFSDSSDGGDYNAQSFKRNLYYTTASESLLLRVRTFTNYHYDENTWYAGSFDTMPQDEEFDRTSAARSYYSLYEEQRPDELIKTVQEAVRTDADFAEKWGLTGFDALSAEPEVRELDVQPLTNLSLVLPAPQYITSFADDRENGRDIKAYMSQNGILFRYNAASNGNYTVRYLPQDYMNCEAVQKLAYAVDSEQWDEFLTDLYYALLGDENITGVLNALSTYHKAQDYMNAVNSQTPDSVRQLAEQLTKDCRTDAEKVIALRDYLVSGAFTYSLEFTRPNDYNVETFLFKYKTGVCYDFAGAYTELCRAVGLPTRNVQGYAMMDHYYLYFDSDENRYVITTEHGHAWAEVYVAGYGWVTVDATAAGNSGQGGGGTKNNVIANLQFSGLGLLGVLIVVLFAVFVVVPLVREKLFRKRFQKLRNAEAVQAAMQRLLKQWDADPSETARDVCMQQEKFLGVDLTDLLNGFERAVYGGTCDGETADRVFRNYCAAYDAYRDAVKREKAARRAERKRAKAAGQPT